MSSDETKDLVQIIRDMKNKEFANHRECWACIDLICHFLEVKNKKQEENE
jgi:hypothetical protein